MCVRNFICINLYIISIHTIEPFTGCSSCNRWKISELYKTVNNFLLPLRMIGQSISGLGSTATMFLSKPSFIFLGIFLRNINLSYEIFFWGALYNSVANLFLLITGEGAGQGGGRGARWRRLGHCHQEEHQASRGKVGTKAEETPSEGEEEERGEGADELLYVPE